MSDTRTFATVPPESEGEAPSYADAREIPWWLRAILAVGGGVLATLLIVAFALDPSPRGFGTHRQLGLPPCTLVQIAGIRCPSCGMTTSWAYLTKGRVLSAFAMNVGGAVFGIYSIALAPYFLASAAIGRWIWRRPNEWAVLFVGGTILATTLVDWTIRIWLT